MAVTLPGTLTSSCQGTRAYWSLLREGGFLDKAEFAPNGVRALWAFALPAYQIATATAPLESLDALAGLKIRAAGSAFELALRTLDAVPVRMAAPEVRESMVRGTIDGSVSPAVSLKPYDMLTVVRHMTQGASFGGFVGAYAMNREAFDALDPAQQEALLKAGEETMERFCAYADASEAAAAAEFEAAGEPSGPTRPRCRPSWPGGWSPSPRIGRSGLMRAAVPEAGLSRRRAPRSPETEREEPRT